MIRYRLVEEARPSGKRLRDLDVILSKADPQTAERKLRSEIGFVSSRKEYVMRIDMFLFRPMAISLYCCCHIPYLVVHADLLLSYSMIALALHNTIILIMTHKSFNPKSTQAGGADSSWRNDTNRTFH